MKTQVTEHEVEQGGHVHAIRLTETADSVRVHFWGRDAWVPAGTVVGTIEDALHTALTVGLEASEAYCARQEVGR